MTEAAATDVALADLVAALADNKCFLGRRYAEWCTGAPMLESAVAAAQDALLGVLRRTPKKTTRALLIGHNPSVQDLVLTLANRASGDARALAETKFPTSGLAVLDLAGEWADLQGGTANLSTFVVPRG